MIYLINLTMMIAAMFVGFVIGYTFDEDLYKRR